MRPLILQCIKTLLALRPTLPSMYIVELTPHYIYPQLGGRDVMPRCCKADNNLLHCYTGTTPPATAASADTSSTVGVGNLSLIMKC